MDPVDIIIETPRLYLRKVSLKDIPEIYRMSLQHEVMEHIPFEEAPTLEGLTELIKNTTLADFEKYGFGRLAIVPKDTGKYIGFTGLKYLEDLDEIDIGYRLNREYWDLGYATEASAPCMEWGFKKKGFPRIIATALAANKSSIHVMEKLGMQFEKKVMEYDLQWEQYVKWNPYTD